LNVTLVPAWTPGTGTFSTVFAGICRRKTSPRAGVVTYTFTAWLRLFVIVALGSAVLDVAGAVRTSTCRWLQPAATLSESASNDVLNIDVMM
jgi:hypothetical protein